MAFVEKKPIKKEDRQKTIIDFIRLNPYCNIEAVVKGVKDDVSRATVFKLLRELIENGSVRRYLENNHKRNARDHKLVVEQDNPLVYVRSELDNFERAYFDLFSKSVVEFNSRIEDARKAILDFGERIVVDDKTSDEDSDRAMAELEKLDDSGNRAIYDLGGLLYNMFNVFYSMVDAYLFRFLSIWPQKIHDKRVLQQLYSIVFSRIADMQTHISEILNSLDTVGVIETNTRLLMRDRFRTKDGLGPLERFSQNFKEIGKEKEIEPVIGSLWKILGELRPHIYPEPQTHGWPFEYEEDDWKKLLSLLRKHRKYTPSDRTGK